MSSNNGGFTGLRPPPRSRSQERSTSSISHRSASSLSSTSNDSGSNASTISKRTINAQPTGRPSTSGGPRASASHANLQNFSRPGPRGASIDSGSVKPDSSMRQALSQAHLGHRPRQHSQGFFEPSLPHASPSNSLSASQIAAAAAMSHLGPPQVHQHERKRSIPGLAAIVTAPPPGRRIPSPVVHSPPGTFAISTQIQSGNVPGRLAATSAANAAYPKSPLPLPNMPTPMEMAPPPVPAPEKTKERSKMKLFSKPKSIGISKERDNKVPPLPSPNMGVFRPGLASASTTSLTEPTASSASSIYSSANISTSTLVPSTANNSSTINLAPTEKEKHRPHFLSRQKHKNNDRNLPLSSAMSNSQAVDPSAPQSLYSFTPQSPGAQSSFAKSMSGLDLRHGGRALREKKKEEKAAAAASLGLTLITSNSSINLASEQRNDFLGPSSLGSEHFFGPPSGASTIFTNDGVAAAFSSLGNNMGLTGITPDDAWPLLKARLLNIFEGEDLRTPIEDFNLLVSVHVRRCVQKWAPTVLIDDLRELLFTGFSSLAQTLRNLPEDRLVPNLVEMWHMVFCTILPFVQAVFLPLDLEFRGHGSIMTQREASEFWGAMPESSKADERPASSGGTLRLPSLGEELDVRRLTLISFRDTVILPRHDQLLVTFSRLSLESIHAGPSEVMSATARSRGISNPTASGAERPGTGGSLSPRLASFNSQASTLLDASSNSSAGVLTRSRAASNTSAGSFGTSLAHTSSPSRTTAFPQLPSSAQPTSAHQRSRSNISLGDQNFPQMDPAQVTETVARMLQCVSVLAGVQTGDQGQAVIERLTGALKWNWLGRGRTGRQRKGFIGMRIGPTSEGEGLAGAVGA